MRCGVPNVVPLTPPPAASLQVEGEPDRVANLAGIIVSAGQPPDLQRDLIIAELAQTGGTAGAILFCAPDYPDSGQPPVEVPLNFCL